MSLTPIVGTGLELATADADYTPTCDGCGTPITTGARYVTNIEAADVLLEG